MNKIRRIFGNNRGFFHLHLLSLSFFFLAAVGAWHVYTSYKQNQLSDNMTKMLNDYKSLTMQAITNAPDRQKLERSLQDISQIVSKVPGAGSISGSNSSKPFYGLDYPYSK